MKQGEWTEEDTSLDGCLRMMDERVETIARQAATITKMREALERISMMAHTDWCSDVFTEDLPGKLPCDCHKAVSRAALLATPAIPSDSETVTIRIRRELAQRLYSRSTGTCAACLLVDDKEICEELARVVARAALAEEGE